MKYAGRAEHAEDDADERGNSGAQSKGVSSISPCQSGLFLSNQIGKEEAVAAGRAMVEHAIEVREWRLLSDCSCRPTKCAQ